MPTLTRTALEMLRREKSGRVTVEQGLIAALIGVVVVSIVATLTGTLEAPAAPPTAPPAAVGYQSP